MQTCPRLKFLRSLAIRMAWAVLTACDREVYSLDRKHPLLNDAPEDGLTRMKVSSGACGFHTTIRSLKDGRRCVRIELSSDCESVQKLGAMLERGEALQMVDFMPSREAKNKVFQLASEALPHSGCPVRVAIIKAAEVELGLAVPRAVAIEFESEPET